MKTRLIVIFILASISVFSQGFYKREKDPQGKYRNDTISDTCHYSINFTDNAVESGLWRLDRKLKDTYSYPVHGWWWADSDDQAVRLLGLRKEYL